MLKPTGVNSLLEVLFKSIQKGDLKKLQESLVGYDGSTQALLISSRAKANGDSLVTVAARHGRLDILKHLREDYGSW